MADILKVYTAEQLYTLSRNKLLADDVALTDFNSGAKTRALIESNSEIVSSISMDHKEAIYKAIAIALYEGFGFSKNPEAKSTGFLRPYRKPALWINYTGAGTAAEITSDSTDFAVTVTGAGADDFSFAYASYPTLTDLVAIIDAETNWSATLVLDGSIASNTLYQYTAKEAIGALNYLYATGLDITLATSVEISVPIGFSVSINQQTFITTIAGTIEAGGSGVAIAAEATIAGLEGNISINAIDTLNGKGFINSVIDGIEQAINDLAFSEGATEETADARKTRFSETVNALNAGTKAGIIAAIKTIDSVRSVGMRTSYPFKGTNTVIVDDGSGAVSAALLALVEQVLYGDPNDLTNFPGKNAEGIGYNISAPNIIPVDVAISATRLPTVNVDLTEIKSDIETAVEQYINTRALGENVLLSEIIRRGKNSNAAVYDLTISSPANDVPISEGDFSKTGTGTGASVVATVSIAVSV